MNRQPRNKLILFIGVLVLATIIFYYAGLNLGLEGIGFGILFPGLFALSFVIDKTSSIFRNLETFLFLLFILLTIASILFLNINMDQFEFTLFKILAAFMGAYIGISLGSYAKLEDYFHIGFILSLILIVYFEYSLGNFNPITFYAPTALRDDFSYNANYYSYMGLFANFSIFRLHLKYRNILTKLGLALIPLLGLTISFTTQSRSGLIFILLINATFWFWINKQKIKNPVYSILRKGLLLAFTLVFLFQFFNVYFNSDIQNRMSKDEDGDARGKLIEKGFDIFIDNPFTGVGGGNFVNYNRFRAFTHNTYLEALAEHGFFIGSLIILVFVLPFFKSYKLYSTNSSKSEYRLSLLFFSIFLLYNNIYVFYKASYAMMYFFLMIGVHNRLSINNIKKT